MKWNQNLIQLIDDRVQVAIRGGRRKRKPKEHILATIDPAYANDGTAPKIITEDDKSETPIGPYNFLSSYLPNAGDRVLLGKVGVSGKYVILDRVTSTGQEGGDIPPHNHDDRYYTEDEVDGKLSEKSDTGHSHSYNNLNDQPKLIIQSNGNTKELVEDTDLDTVFDTGIYFVEGAENAPWSMWSHLKVFRHSENRVFQTYIADNANRMAMRVYNGSWSSWDEIYHEGNTTVDSDGFIKKA
ncbi:hypothetical protein D7Z54_14595 [Salibacterium salarium]|uniref:Uncharacterized protein n=1 Tax=Salibacterium salarium TaxID=284579 RepID=A0A3R9P4J4_9BACI|nr:pyocin knob domain-containing protein [Salibacterium salarium]RSL32675.1 hypothetical protein D7Z54_14595 [Salibacterium salarium]